MAFSFFGVFTTGQWESFKAFSRTQILELRLRRQWLQKQLLMNGIFETEYDGPRPVSFLVNPGSYAAKLMEAYRVLGGNPETDMLLRTRDQPVYKVSGTEIKKNADTTVSGGYSDVYSNGRRERGNQRFDRDLGLRVEALKEWQLDAIKLKREKLEFKIKRALDYSDQLQQEISLLDKLLGDDTVQGSANSQILDVEIQMAQPGAMTVVDDVDDVFGLSIGRPGDYAFGDAVNRTESEDERLPK